MQGSDIHLNTHQPNVNDPTATDTLHVSPPASPPAIGNPPTQSTDTSIPPPNSPWQPPEGSNLHWITIDDAGPFLTNATLSQLHQTEDPLDNEQDSSLRFDVCFETQGLNDESDTQQATLITTVQITTETPSPTRPESSLSLRMCQDDFHFKRGDSSTNPLSQQGNDNHLLEASFAQFHLESNQIVRPIECTSTEIDPTLLTTVYGPPIADEAHCPGPPGSSHFIQPHVPLPPTNLALSLSHSQNLPLPFHVA
ncbi:hypothetical protein FCV25MIE_15699 [Fagus crenata]